MVDDDPAVRGSLQFSLELEGYEVRVFSDARELLNDPAIAHFDCIIIDRNLPTFDGLELAVQLRDRSVFVPVILTTSQPSEFLARRARSAGFDRREAAARQCAGREDSSAPVMLTSGSSPDCLRFPATRAHVVGNSLSKPLAMKHS